jgi:hypothetical protein
VATACRSFQEDRDGIGSIVIVVDDKDGARPGGLDDMGLNV